MNKYPYIPKAMNDLFKKEKSRIDYLFFRPILLIFGVLNREIWILTVFPASICPEKPSIARYGFLNSKNHVPGVLRP